ncbi:MAG: hypothetical protein B7Y15_13465 [Bacteroidetes bacterium 24-39-8]|jgi:hypothetical protein|nr:MAG: hypothetical protein B7Y15_13465 [Bacteroidetes bacterium 24-39-8]HQS55810.1 hypothetical protein [Sediminibacterium sp.]
MKLVVLVSLLFLSNYATGQITSSLNSNNKIDSIFSNVFDTTINVIYIKKDSVQKKPAFFLDGKYIPASLLSSSKINPNKIKSINVVSEPFKIDNIDYWGKVQIVSIDNYIPKPISLKALKEKYTNLNNKPTLFMIDGNLVNEENSDYIVDEKNILSITVDTLKVKDEKIDLALVKILTKSEENIKKSKEIRIKGIGEN